MYMLKKSTKLCILYGIQSFVITLSILPILWVTLSSFKTNSQILSGSFVMPSDIRTAVDIYTYLFEKYNFLGYFWNSLWISAISTFISLVCFAMAAYVLAKYRFYGRNLIFLLFTITILVPGHAKAQPIFSLINSMHLYDTKTGLILVYLGSGIAMSIFILRSTFMAIPKELDEAAWIDGANFWQIFFQINLPLAKSGLSTAGILMFLGNWNEYFYASLLTASEKNRTLPVALQFFNQSLTYDYTKMFAALTIVIVPAVLVYCLVQEQVQESVAASGLKG